MSRESYLADVRRWNAVASKVVVETDREPFTAKLQQEADGFVLYLDAETYRALEDEIKGNA